MVTVHEINLNYCCLIGIHILFVTRLTANVRMPAVFQCETTNLSFGLRFGFKFGFRFGFKFGLRFWFSLQLSVHLSILNIIGSNLLNKGLITTWSLPGHCLLTVQDTLRSLPIGVQTFTGTGTLRVSLDAKFFK